MIAALKVNINPPLWEILLWPLARLFGRSGFTARIPSLAASLVMMYVVWRPCQESRLNRTQKAIVLGFFTLLPSQFYFAQERRVYALFTLLFLIGILWATQGRWVGLTAVMGLMLWSHYIALVYLPVMWIVAWVMVPRCWKPLLSATLLAGASWLPWLLVFIYQTDTQISWFLPLTVEYFLEHFGRSLFVWTLRGVWFPIALYNLIFTIAWSLIKPAAEWILDFRKTNHRDRGHSLQNEKIRIPSGRLIPPRGAVEEEIRKRIWGLLVLLPLVLLIVIGMIYQSILLYRTIFPLRGPFAFWISLELTSGRAKPIGLALLCAWIGLTWVALLGWSAGEKGGNLNYILQRINSGWQNNDILYHSSGLTALVFHYYKPDARSYLLDLSQTFAKTDLTIQQISILQDALEDIPYNRAWVVWQKDRFLNGLDFDGYFRMQEYVRDCRFVDRITNDQIWPAEIYLCENQAQGSAWTH